jgi:hypothetical protein
MANLLMQASSHHRIRDIAGRNRRSGIGHATAGISTTPLSVNILIATNIIRH